MYRFDLYYFQVLVLVVVFLSDPKTMLPSDIAMIGLCSGLLYFNSLINNENSLEFFGPT